MSPGSPGEMMLRTGDDAVYVRDGVRVPVKIIRVTGEGDLMDTQVQARVTEAHDGYQAGSQVAGDGMRFMLARPSPTGGYYMPLWCVPDGRYCPAHERDIAKMDVSRVADRNTVRWECDHRRNCAV